MKKVLFVFALLFFASSPLFAQSRGTTRAASAKNEFPSVDDMFGSLSGEGGRDFSLTDALQDMMGSMQSRTITENTEASVRSAIQGRLVVEEVVPEVNREVVEAVDSVTRRYSPRLQIDYREFPLQPSTSIEGNAGLAAKISNRLRLRLRSEGIAVECKERVVRLHGAVASERQRELAEMMVRFEPGIDAVENNLRVESPKTE